MKTIMYPIWSRSIKFYNEALDLHEVRRKTANDFIIVYLSNEVSDFELELTWLKEHRSPIIWANVNFTWHSGRTIMKRRIKSTKRWAAFALKMKKWGSILSKIPDGYWLEILP